MVTYRMHISYQALKLLIFLEVKAFESTVRFDITMDKLIGFC